MKKVNKGAVPSPRSAADAISELTTNRLSVYLRCLNVLDAEVSYYMRTSAATVEEVDPAAPQIAVG